MMNSLVTRVRKTNNLTIVKEYDIPYELKKQLGRRSFCSTILEYMIRTELLYLQLMKIFHIS